MHTSKYTPALSQYLTTACDHLDYILTAKGIEEGESYLDITLVPMDRSLPDLYVDIDKDGKLVFSTLLPRDRWGYAHQAYSGASSASQKVDPNKNSAERCAKYVDKMLTDYAVQHGHHAKRVADIEAAYDRQMATFKGILGDLEEIGAVGRGQSDRPNRNGHLVLDIFIPGRSHSISVGYGGSVNVNLGGVTPEQAAEIMRILCK